MKNKINGQTVVMIFVHHDKQNFEFKVVNDDGTETSLRTLPIDRLKDINKSVAIVSQAIDSEVRRHG